jgi:uncharacterized protein involved in exopolysaccharide biosynthesis
MTTTEMPANPEAAQAIDDDAFGVDLLTPLLESWKLIVGGALALGFLVLGITFLLTPRFTAQTTFLPPQAAQSSAAAALSQLGALAGLAGGAVGVKSTADQYVALLRSINVSDRLIERFDLQKVYDVKLRVEARETLAKRVGISLGRKDGLITVSVEDVDPDRAARMANQYVDELRRITSELALTEAQQRRQFFEAEFKAASERLAQAQAALQASGFNAGALKAEPKAAAESYARLRAEATAAEIRLQTLRSRLADTSAEVQQQLSQLMALRSQLARVERDQGTGGGDTPDYVARYRDFKYQEALFELFARQYEMARLDESREGALIQVIDVATPPERKSWPRRGLSAVAATFAGGVLLTLYVLARALRGARRPPA